MVQFSTLHHGPQEHDSIITLLTLANLNFNTLKAKDLYSKHSFNFHITI